MQVKTAFIRHFGFLIFSALFLSTTLPGCKRPNQDEPVVKIGVVLPLTGEVAPYGTDCRNGVEMGIAEASGNASVKVVGVYEDSKNEAKAALAAVQKLIHTSDVKAIIGDMGSATTLAIAPIAQESKVVLLTPTAADPKIPQTGDHVFSIYPSAEDEGRFMATQIPVAQLQRVVTVKDNAEVFLGIEKGFSSGLQARSGSVVARETLPEDVSILGALAAKVHAQNPSAVYLAGYKDNIARFVQALREQDSTVPLYSQSTMLDAEIGQKYRSALEGMIFSGPPFSDLSTDTTVAEFKQKYQAKFGKPPTVWAAYGYDAAAILTKSFQAVGSTPDTVAKNLPGTVHDGLTGQITIGKDREVRVALVKYRFTNGAIELLPK